MFENEIAVNRFQLGVFEKLAPDIDEAALYLPSPGHGHPPAWILGHLAATGESGQRLLGGGAPAHAEWMALFGPGSKDRLDPVAGAGKQELIRAVVDAYTGLQQLAAAADPDAMNAPQRFPFFRGTPIQTVGHCVTLLLTSHFGLHMSQLSSCRRAAGHPALF